MSKRLLAVPLLAALALSGCVTVPTGPRVAVYPGTQKSFDQFRVDDGDCRQYSHVAIGGADSTRAANDAAAANAAAGTLAGAAVGALIGAASGNAGAGAAWGAGTGLLFGSAAGSNTAYYSAGTLQRDYDVAYMQCMYARGNQVPGRMAYQGSRSYPPPNTPAPNYPPPDQPAPNYPAQNGPAAKYPPPNTPPPQ